MRKTRINDLARELEVKSKAVLDYLHEIGVENVKSHSSAIEEEAAGKVRAHFQALSQGEAAPAESGPPEPPPTTPAVPTHAIPRVVAHEPAKVSEAKPEPRALTRTIAEI